MVSIRMVAVIMISTISVRRAWIRRTRRPGIIIIVLVDVDVPASIVPASLRNVAPVAGARFGPVTPRYLVPVAG
jgi:hypothetical protein